MGAHALRGTMSEAREGNALERIKVALTDGGRDLALVLGIGTAETPPSLFLCAFCE